MSSLSLIVGVGSGLSASLARIVASRGQRPVLAARDTSDLKSLQEETGAVLIDCDASKPADVERLFTAIDDLDGSLDLAVFNPSYRTMGPIAELHPVEVRRCLEISAFGAFLMAHHSAKRMLTQGHGTMLFTGATASVKGFPGSAAFAMGKFALRGLCQSLARELHPKNIHVGHIVIDGGIKGTPQHNRNDGVQDNDSMLDPNHIATSYMAFVDQHRSAWSWEIEVRPWVERF